jgi:hypothetical protein
MEEDEVSGCLDPDGRGAQRLLSGTSRLLAARGDCEYSGRHPRLPRRRGAGWYNPELARCTGSMRAVQPSRQKTFSGRVAQLAEQVTLNH